jgi:hypothetical protein
MRTLTYHTTIGLILAIRSLPCSGGAEAVKEVRSRSMPDFVWRKESGRGRGDVGWQTRYVNASPEGPYRLTRSEDEITGNLRRLT